MNYHMWWYLASRNRQIDGVSTQPDIHNCLNKFIRGTWMAQSEEHMILDLRVGGSSPMLGVEVAK